MEGDGKQLRSSYNCRVSSTSNGGKRCLTPKPLNLVGNKNIHEMDHKESLNDTVEVVISKM